MTTNRGELPAEYREILDALGAEFVPRELLRERVSPAAFAKLTEMIALGLVGGEWPPDGEHILYRPGLDLERPRR